ncbi:MAG: hypothetical protein ACI9IT_002034 [Glaciecola sp.]|jgi:hypothetical protein
MFIRQQPVGSFDATLTYAEDKITRPMRVTLALDPFNKLLTQLANDVRPSLCILGVTVLRHVFKIINSFRALVFSDVWRLI